MKILEPGHVYALDSLDGEMPESGKHLVFVNREPDAGHPGTQTQEVLRALIDRTFHCHHCLPHELNPLIIHHLRMALILHEARALGRKADRGELNVENMKVGKDGHFEIPNFWKTENEASKNERNHLVYKRWTEGVGNKDDGNSKTG